MGNIDNQVNSRPVRTFAPSCLLMLFSLFVTLSALPGWGQYAPQQPQGQEAPPPPPPPPPDQGQYPAAEQPQAPPRCMATLWPRPSRRITCSSTPASWRCCLSRRFWT